ncbi:MAG: ATPase [Prevotella sp.]|nr:ATPase [Prevotella sp.]
MRLIADSGSTKTDWIILSESGLRRRFATAGLNPLVAGSARFKSVIAGELLPLINTFDIDAIEFYGAGCTPEMCPEVRRILSDLIPEAKAITVDSDLTGACRAVAKGEECIVAILGTGSNSCLFDGTNIVRHTPPLGYILGDEGSGAALGKLFLNALLKGRLPERISEQFFATLRLSESDVISRVYRSAEPNKFLASLAPFIASVAGEQSVNQIIIDNFRAFFALNIRPYRRPDLPVHCVGSIARYFAGYLQLAAREEGYTLGQILRSPLDALVG